MTKKPSLKASASPAAAPTTPATKRTRKTPAPSAATAPSAAPRRSRASTQDELNRETRKVLEGMPTAPAPSAEAPAEPRRPGRPLTYSREVADKILRRLAAGESISAICRDDGMPPASTFRGWVLDDVDGVAARYARASELGFEALADECLEIAEDGRNDWMERLGPKGQGMGWVLNGEAVQRSRLRIETRMKLLSKWAPRRYGDKLELSGSVEMTLAQRLKALDEKPVPAHAPLPTGV